MGGNVVIWRMKVDQRGIIRRRMIEGGDVVMNDVILVVDLLQVCLCHVMGNVLSN